MAQHNYDMTGVLVLERITPVISALFGQFEVEPLEDGRAWIRRISEVTETSWDPIVENLRKLTASLSVNLPDDADESIEEYLFALADHFKADSNYGLLSLIEHVDFDASPGMTELFTIAKAFDDGHGLTSMQCEGAWYCDKPLLFQFGGNAMHLGTHVTIKGNSTSLLSLGTNLERALAAGDTSTAADRIRQTLDCTLAGIHDDQVRGAVRNSLGLDNAAAARRFMAELLDSVETLSGIADEHGPRTLADLMFLSSAIMNGTYVEHCPGESKLLEVVQGLPSACQWTTFIKTVIDEPAFVAQIVALHIWNPHSQYDAAEDEANQYLTEARQRGEVPTVEGFKAWLNG